MALSSLLLLVCDGQCSVSAHKEPPRTTIKPGSGMDTLNLSTGQGVSIDQVTVIFRREEKVLQPRRKGSRKVVKYVIWNNHRIPCLPLNLLVLSPLAQYHHLRDICLRICVKLTWSPWIPISPRIRQHENLHSATISPSKGR